MYIWYNFLSAQEIWEVGKESLNGTIPSDRNWEFVRSTSNSAITSKTFFNAAINVWLWKWLRSRRKNCYFLCTSCNSSFKTLEELRIRYGMLKMHKHILKNPDFPRDSTHFQVGCQNRQSGTLQILNCSHYILCICQLQKKKGEKVKKIYTYIM